MAWTRRQMITGCGGAATLLMRGAGAAQSSYPSRTTKIIVPYPAGGSTDFVGRGCRSITDRSSRRR